MMYESNIGLIYKNKAICLFIEKETIKKIKNKISIIKKINLLKKIIMLKNTKKLNLKKVSDRDYEALQWICKIYNIKKVFKKSWIAWIVDIPFKNWENKIKTFKMKENNFKIFKNTISIKYRKEYSFLIYMFINETIDGSEYNKQETTVIIDGKVVKWEGEKTSKIIKKIMGSKKCILLSNRDFLYYVEMELDSRECMYDVESQTI